MQTFGRVRLAVRAMPAGEDVASAHVDETHPILATSLPENVREQRVAVDAMPRVLNLIPLLDDGSAVQEAIGTRLGNLPARRAKCLPSLVAEYPTATED
jgi:hypothetical protein